jgi:hypothetical protein
MQSASIVCMTSCKSLGHSKKAYELQEPVCITTFRHHVSNEIEITYSEPRHRELPIGM